MTEVNHNIITWALRCAIKQTNQNPDLTDAQREDVLNQTQNLLDKWKKIPASDIQCLTSGPDSLI